MRKYQARFGGGLLEKDQSRDWHLAGSLPYYTTGGKAVTTFAVAVNRASRDADGHLKEEVEWVPIVAWEKLAETCNQYLDKGSRVYIEGRLQTRAWEDANGAKHSRTEVVAYDLIMLDSRTGQTREPVVPVRDWTPPPPAHAADDDELPF